MSLSIHRLVRTLAAVAFAGVALPALAQTEIQWWHSMTGALNDRVNEFAKGFNESQKEFKVVPVYKGAYPESMAAAIAAFRAGNLPQIRDAMDEELEAVWAGKKTPQQGLDDAVQRGNEIIDRFNKANRQ